MSRGRHGAAGAELEATSRKYGVTARTIATARHPNQ